MQKQRRSDFALSTPLQVAARSVIVEMPASTNTRSYHEIDRFLYHAHVQWL